MGGISGYTFNVGPEPVEFVEIAVDIEVDIFDIEIEVEVE